MASKKPHTTTGKDSYLPFIGIAIRKMLKDRKLMQKEITSVSESYMSRISSGERVPVMETLELVCEECGVDLCDFFHIYVRPLKKKKG
jgi:transcriptional regulator with XRE-family HTH domain